MKEGVINSHIKYELVARHLNKQFKALKVCSKFEYLFTLYIILTLKCFNVIVKTM